MFFREENPELFDIIISEYSKNHKLLETKEIRQLDENQLNEIESIFVPFDKNIKSLNGIQHCKNLKSFQCEGLVNGDYLSNNNERIVGQQENLSDEDFDWRIDNLNIHQIEDISPLYECTKLEELDIESQVFLEELDLSKWKKLKTLDMIDCPNLKSVDGLKELIVENNFDSKKHFYFAGCDKLSRINDFLECVKFLDSNNVGENDININLSTLSYYRLCKNYPNHDLEKALNHYANNSNCANAILWGENFNKLGTEICLHTAMQMYLTKSYIDTTIKEEVVDKKCKNDYEIIKNIYEWIIGNIEYDFDGVLQRKQMDIDLVSKTAFFGNMRSSFMGLWTKKCVCAGFANILNSFLVEMGYDASFVLVNNLNNSKANFASHNSNHAITKIESQNGNYYFDPSTQDYRVFFATRSELLKKNYMLTYREYLHSKNDKTDDFLCNKSLFDAKPIIKNNAKMQPNYELNGQKFSPILLKGKDKIEAQENIEKMKKERLFPELL